MYFVSNFRDFTLFTFSFKCVRKVEQTLKASAQFQSQWISFCVLRLDLNRLLTYSKLVSYIRGRVLAGLYPPPDPL